MKKAETQEQEFLEVCSSYDHDLLTGKKEMTLKDYERITYLVSSLGYSQYLQFLIGKYMDLAQADEEREEREHEIYLEYPEYYEDEGILEEEKWLEEFLNQLPEKKREYFEKLIKGVKATKKVTVFRCSDHSNFLSLYKGKQMLIDKIFFS